MRAGISRKRKTFLGNRSKSRNFLIFNNDIPLESRLLLAADYNIAGAVAGELLIQYRPDVNVQSRALNRLNIGALLKSEIASPLQFSHGDGLMELVRIPEGISAEECAKFFINQPGVEFAEPNFRISVTETSNDPAYTGGNLWNMYGADALSPSGPSGTTNEFGSNAEAAWNAGNTGSKTVVIGIVDTGIQVTHPDLASNIWVNPNDPTDGVDNDGNGYIDDSNGWDFVGNDKTVYDGLSDLHGTHVAGIIGAQGGNAVGVAGVSWNVLMISAKFIGPQGGTTADAVRAIDYLTNLKIRNGVNIAAINASWGASNYSAAINSAILRAAKADILFVAAAGNNRVSTDQTPFYPACLSTLNATSTETAAGYDAVISVGALTNTGTLAVFSNYGKNTVDLVAPGSIVNSTVPNGYAANSGTSMAAPHVTGAIALYAARYPGTSAALIKEAILASATSTDGMAEITVTGGRLDANRALAIQPPPASSISSISISDVSILEGAAGINYAEVTVGLNQLNSATITVDYATENGTASSGSDFTALSGRLTFLPGIRSQVIRIPINGDTAVEPDETLFVRLSNASNTATISRNQASIIIVNDDNVTAIPTISASNITITEGDAGSSFAIFTITRSGNLALPSVISYVTASRTAQAFQDFTPVSGSLVFMPRESSKQVRVSIIGDRSVENDEFFGLLLSSTINSRINTREAGCTIIDNDSSVNASATSRSSNGRIIPLPIQMAKPSNGNRQQNSQQRFPLISTIGIGPKRIARPSVNQSLKGLVRIK
jgi:subtilisin family serine protease